MCPSSHDLGREWLGGMWMAVDVMVDVSTEAELERIISEINVDSICFFIFNLISIFHFCKVYNSD